MAKESILDVFFIVVESNFTTGSFCFLTDFIGFFFGVDGVLAFKFFSAEIELLHLRC